MSSNPLALTDHAESAGKAYRERRPSYERFAETLRSLLSTCLAGLPIHVIEGRAKSFESFVKKAAKAQRDDARMPRYPDPIQQITDLAGVRVITYFPDAIELVEDVIRRELVVVERTDKSRAFEDSGKLGYQSVHFLVKLGPLRLPLPEYSPFADLVAEIQVRTILQHAWAEMEHDIQYKSEDQIPTEIRRRFASLAGLIEIADREFQAIQDSDAELRKQIRASLDISLEGAVATGAAVAASGKPVAEYVDEMARFDALVEGEPNQFAHYLGRAKIRFLMGDRTGALKDLDEAEKVAPDHDHVVSARRKIDQGLVAPPLVNDAARKLLANGLKKLAAGDGDGALGDFDAAYSLCSDVAFVPLDRAFAFCLLGRLDEAEQELGKIKPHQGSFVKADIIACRSMIDAWRSGQPSDAQALDAVLLELGGKFDLSFSALRHLESGLKIASPSRHAVVAHIFEKLRPSGRP